MFGSLFCFESKDDFLHSSTQSSDHISHIALCGLNASMVYFSVPTRDDTETMWKSNWRRKGLIMNIYGQI